MSSLWSSQAKSGQSYSWMELKWNVVQGDRKMEIEWESKKTQKNWYGGGVRDMGCDWHPFMTGIKSWAKAESWDTESCLNWPLGIILNILAFVSFLWWSLDLPASSLYFSQSFLAYCPPGPPHFRTREGIRNTVGGRESIWFSVLTVPECHQGSFVSLIVCF